MSILIKGMEMPKTLEVFMLISPSGKVIMFRHCGLREEILATGTAIELPPHGRLIDADVAYDTIAEADNAGNYVDMDAVGLALEEVPTIIEAEGTK